MDIFKNMFTAKNPLSENLDGQIHDRGVKGKPIYEFDPSGLERAARAARELRDSPHAERLLEIASSDSYNKRLEILKDQKLLEQKLEQAKIDGMRQQHEYAVEILKEEAKTHRTKAEYEDFLARKRQEDRMQMEKTSQAEILKVQEESVKRQEEIRKQTIDYEFSKRVASEKELSAQFWKNKSAYKMDTKDIIMAKYSLKMDNQFKKSQMVMSSFGVMAADAFNSFYDNKKRFLSFAGGVCILTAGVVLSRRSVSLGIKCLESYLMTPKLVKEHKTVNMLSRFRVIPSPSMSAGSPLFNDLETQGLIYNPLTEKTLREIVESTKTCLSNDGYLRNFLFYGPPGTGKTLFAKRLSLYSGMNYAILSGGDVVPLKEKAVTELHNVFDWSNRSRQGMILFLDEADAFLKKRDQPNIGEEMRSALNSFLYRTGDASKNLMLILATNKPEHLDGAVTDRVDTMVEFDLPDESTRRRLFEYYFNLHLAQQNLDNFSIGDVINKLVTMSEGFSAREISKLCWGWRVIADSRPDKLINENDILERVMGMKKQHKIKRAWENSVTAPVQAGMSNAQLQQKRNTMTI